MLLQPFRRFPRIAACIDRKAAQRHAAIHGSRRYVEFGGELFGCNLGIDAGHEQFLGQTPIDDIETARDPPGATCRDDHRVGRLPGERLGQRHREAEESEGIDKQYGSDETQDHSIFLRDERTVMRAV